MLPAKRLHLKQNGVFSQNKQDTENVVHLATFCPRIVSDVLKCTQQICRNFKCSIITSGLPIG